MDINLQEVSDPDEQDLYEHHRFEVDKGQAFLRIDKFLINRLENSSRNKIQNAAEAGCILVNGVAVKSSYKVKPLDVISIVMARPPRDTEIYPENIPLNIFYEDDDVVVVNKPPGMVVHPAFGNFTGTLVNALVYHFQNLPTTRNGVKRPGLVHRIDKNTSGLLVIAKTEIAMTSLAKEFFDHTIERKYIALVWGDLPQNEGTITGHIGRSLKDRKVMSVFTDGSYGKHAITHYHVLERFGFVTLISCKLETGRTHQIRAHFQYIGHPLFNDDTYGGNRVLKGNRTGAYLHFIEECFQILPRQALHAKSLGFIHPTNKTKLFFDSELPLDFINALEMWREFIAL
jgi:23S rRNA pseudouridine1911/1915/1917 synthase